ncbi:MAG: glycoside hydrolase family 2 protein, partial [Anaerolineae bacterium]|nr:glycoside hydrolase family 2 protein [Anaerolineae bacterium]
PQLWWPNGLGEQPLYQAQVSLLDGSNLLDEQTFQVGLRQLELRQDPDAWGKTFQFVVNGVPIFARGADWIPADSLPTRMTAERYDTLIRDAAAANMNMLRIWGGGYYEDEYFYDACDRYGILVWQDFMFACAAYPLDEPDFLENVRVEIEENVQRLRHRACLALWCGNNEIEMMWGLWKRHKSLTKACESFFYHQLPAWVESLDPDRAYWPSSPSSGKFMDKTNSDNYGDTHLWQVWHGLRPFTYFRKRFTRMASEFGLESLPDLKTFHEYTEEKDLRMDGEVVLHHQRSAGGNDKILYYLTDRFQMPREFSDLIYLSQILQAEAMRHGFEHWRRNSPRCNGALYWQYNDCWPVTSWASVDYNGRWKALQYVAKRFNAPLALSLEDEGNTVRPYVINERREPWQGTLTWTLETLSGEIVKSGEKEISAAPLAVVRLKLFDFSGSLQSHGKEQLVFTASLKEGNQRTAWQTALFSLEKKMEFPDHGLEWTLTQDNGSVAINLSAKAFARFVWLDVEGADVVFSDNSFDLPANWNTTITCPLPAGWALEQFEQALRVRSLADVEPGGTPFSDHLLHIQMGLKPTSLITRVIFSFIE